MMADIFYPIFTLTITVLAFSVLYMKKKKTKLFGDFAPTPSPRHRPRPLGGLTAPPDPQLQSLLTSPKTNASIFFSVLSPDF